MKSAVCVGLAALVMASPGSAAALRLADRSISAAALPPAARGTAGIAVTLAATRAHSVAAASTDFQLSAAGDLFAAQGWNGGRTVRVAAGHARTFRLRFPVARAALSHAALFYRPADAPGIAAVVPVAGMRRGAQRAQQLAANLKTFSLSPGIGDPWGTAVDGSGHVWFAEPGCDFAPVCASNAPPGELGELDPSTGAVTYFKLPSISGNQPAFVAFDGAGKLWFTTPDNSMIGELDPTTGTLVGQWQVASGSGPWDLTVAGGKIWYTEHLVAAIGAFDPATHSFQDFNTPTANSNPYGIAASGGLLWFTENNSSVDRVGVLDTTRGDAISEYQVVLPFSGTPHLIAVGPDGHPWWTEGWANTIATLDPAVATPGNCGVSSGACKGIQRYHLPPATTCTGNAHASGIAIQPGTARVWIDNSLTTQVGSFDPATATYDLTELTNCGAHPHDGLSVDAAGNAWFNEEFTNSIGELVAPYSVGGSGPGATTPGPPSPVSGPKNTGAPSIHGSPRQADTLIASKGSWANSPTSFSYAWQRCGRRCVTVASGPRNSYTLAADDIGAKVRVVVTASNPGGSAQAGSRGLGPVGPSVGRVRGALRALVRSAGRWKIAALVRPGYRARFDAPSRGRLRVTVRARGGRLLVASGRRRFGHGGAGSLALTVTGRGAAVLRHSKRLTIVTKAVYVPIGERAVTSARRWTIS